MQGASVLFAKGELYCFAVIVDFSPSVICFAGYMRIEYHHPIGLIPLSQSETITQPRVAYPLTDKKKEKTRCNKQVFSFLLLADLGYCPTVFVLTNAIAFLNAIFEFSVKNNTEFCGFVFCVYYLLPI